MAPPFRGSIGPARGHFSWIAWPPRRSSARPDPASSRDSLSRTAVASHHSLGKWLSPRFCLFRDRSRSSRCRGNIWGRRCRAGFWLWDCCHWYLLLAGIRRLSLWSLLIGCCSCLLGLGCCCWWEDLLISLKSLWQIMLCLFNLTLNMINYIIACPINEEYYEALQCQQS